MITFVKAKEIERDENKENAVRASYLLHLHFSPVGRRRSFGKVE